jgi:thiamine-monophosphate kinase
MSLGGRPLRDIGEFALLEQIARVAERPEQSSRLKLGIGDDAAVWEPRPHRWLVVSSDTLVERVHFRLDWTDWESLGHKALAVNLSDLAAMGARPWLALVALGLRGSERDQEIMAFYRGMRRLADRFRVEIVGGDLSSSPQAVTITVTVIGDGPNDPHGLLTRSAAQPGDWIGVTGPLGLAAAGLRIYERDLRLLDGSPVMQEAYNRPCPRVREGLLLRRCGVHAAMDISDGLFGDLPKMCQQSHVSAVVDLCAIPIPNAVKWAFDDWQDVALRTGEDYELLFTAPPPIFERVSTVFARSGLRPPYRIGEVIPCGEEGPQLFVRNVLGRVEPIVARGYSHFTSP